MRERESPLKYVMMLSGSYSGSTLLSILLCSHPEIIGFGDTYARRVKRYSEYSHCTCGAKAKECRFRKDIERAMRQDGFPHLRLEYLCATPMPDCLKPFYLARRLFRVNQLAYLYSLIPSCIRELLFCGFYAQNISYLKALKKCGHFNIYFDGAKSIPRFELLRTHIPDIRLLHLVRDPRSFMYSCIHHHSETFDHAKHYRWRMNQWVRYNNLARRYKGIMGDTNYLLIRYEDLASRPVETIQIICSFMRVDSSPIEHLERINVKNLHIVGNPMRRHFRTVQDRSDEWKGRLDPKICSYVCRKASDIDWIKKLYPELEASSVGASLKSR